MFSWKVLCSTALIVTWAPDFLVKSAACASNCLANVVPLSLVPQVTVPPTLPPASPPAPPSPPPESPPPQPASAVGRPTAAVTPSAVLNRERRLRLDSPATEGGTIRARYSASDSGRDTVPPGNRERPPTRARMLTSVAPSAHPRARVFVKEARAIRCHVVTGGAVGTGRRELQPESGPVEKRRRGQSLGQGRCEPLPQLGHHRPRIDILESSELRALLAAQVLLHLELRLRVPRQQHVLAGRGEAVGDDLGREVEALHTVQRRGDLVQQRAVLVGVAWHRHDWGDGQPDRVTG